MSGSGAGMGWLVVPWLGVGMGVREVRRVRIGECFVVVVLL